MAQLKIEFDGVRVGERLPLGDPDEASASSSGRWRSSRSSSTVCGQDSGLCFFSETVRMPLLFSQCLNTFCILNNQNSKN